VLVLFVQEGWARQENKPRPRPLPEKIVKEWKEAGAEVGWMRAHRDYRPEFIREAEGVAGDVPAFRFQSWKDGVLQKLTDPGQPFGLSLDGLSLDGAKVTDAGLK